MNSWCESCARKSCCYTMEIRPRCYVATTNTASGTPESYLAKSLRYSRDNHEIAKDEPQTEKGGCTNCDGKDLCNNAFTEISQYCGAYEPQNGYQTFNGTSVYVSRLEDEPQTYITEDRTQMLDRWQTYHRNTTSAVTPCSNCQEFDCYGCEYKQTERSE